MLMRVIGTAGLLGAGVLLGRTMHRVEGRKLRNEPAKPPVPKIRDAGPEAMNQPPRRWDMVDQQADESFPASDPPGNY